MSPDPANLLVRRTQSLSIPKTNFLQTAVTMSQDVALADHLCKAGILRHNTHLHSALSNTHGLEYTHGCQLFVSASSHLSRRSCLGCARNPVVGCSIVSKHGTELTRSRAGVCHSTREEHHVWLNEHKIKQDRLVHARLVRCSQHCIASLCGAAQLSSAQLSARESYVLHNLQNVHHRYLKRLPPFA